MALTQDPTEAAPPRYSTVVDVPEFDALNISDPAAEPRDELASNSASDRSENEPSAEEPATAGRDQMADEDKAAGDEEVASENLQQPINVLIVGESQQGKSTLIDALYRYAGIANMDVPIGHGNVRCTTSVNRYDVAATLHKYGLVDAHGSEIKGLSYSDLCDLAEDEARVVRISDGAEPTLNFMMIDTPGLDDSEGDDFDIMASIIGTVGSMQSINAIVYVRQMGKPFSTSFKQFFDYIQRCMPALSNGLIIINTNFTIDENERYVSQRSNLVNVRREAFMASTGLDLSHFFMDNNPYRDQPFAVLQSLNEMYRLLSYLSSQLPIATTNLKLLKTSHMQSYDVHIINALLEAKSSLEREWSAERAHGDALHQGAMTNQRQLSRTRRRLDQKRALVDELSNGPDIHLGSKSCVEDYSFFGDLLFKGNLNLGRRRMEFDANCEITRVTKTCSSATQWLNEEQRGTSWRAELTSRVFRDINGTATFYTTSRIKHRAEIRALEGAIADLEEALDDAEEAAARNSQISDKAATLGENVEATDQLVQTLKKDTFAIEFWPRIRYLYLSDRRPSKDDVRFFVSVFDDKVAKLL